MSQQNPIFIPGPTNLPDRLRLAMHVQSQDHRSKNFIDTFAPALEEAKKVFGTIDGKVLLFASSGTGGWEAAISNTLCARDRVLICRNGAFSHRWINLCQRHDLDVEIVEAPWGAAAPANAYEIALKADLSYKAVLVTHNETATGVRSNVAAVRQAMDNADSNALLMVDGVSSIASMEFRMDDWGVDIAVCGSQKGFMLATGMAILAISPKAIETMEHATLPRTFFDFNDMLKNNASGGFPYTPPLQLIYGLRESLKMLLEEGLENVYARHFRLAEGVRRAVTAWELRTVAHSSNIASDTVTAIYVPEGRDANELTDHANNAYGVSFGIGLGKLNGKAFRIGHLGSLTDVMVLSGLATIEMSMADLNYPITLGSGVATAQEYYRQTK
ncbi:MAG: aminotransferase class V-fold PLP-dependent enzyme [Alphaproteobacteria bacterium]|nr:aminotransferase class V-fold PLP-dependent enzyme [Alphaproteobacteria bacterium]